MKNLKYGKRTKYCGDFRQSDVSVSATVCGWVSRRRDLGGVLFVDLRDRTGILQLAFDDSTDKTVFNTALSLRNEFVISASGVIRERSSKNPDLPTGDVELEVAELTILAASETPPFEIEEGSEVGDALRLKYRYLDLRRPDMQSYITTRHRAVKLTRDFFDENGFLEIETPMLTKSTPEGARDYLVPSRVHKGAFYALPQSPQQYKQLIMLAGFDRYMQIVRCFRDEDLRADRQPEFTQIDLEMSFVDEGEIFSLIDSYVKRLFGDLTRADISLPISQLTWREAMDRFGSDKPDLRFGLELCDISDIARSCDFNVFSQPAKNGGSVRMIYVPGGASLPRKQLDSLADFVKTFGAKGLAWAKFGDDYRLTALSSACTTPIEGSFSSSFSKFLTEDENTAIFERAEANPGGLILIVADASDDIVFASLGALRCEIAKRLNLIRHGEYKFVWVTEFPLFEYSTEEDRLVARHHPFTAPMCEDINLFASSSADKHRQCRARAYDLILNGSELGGGSIRINTPELQAQMLSKLGFSKDQAQSRFGHLIDAFKYGAPPHGGIAFGLDRIIMHLCGLSSIRDVIAFPKVQNASELLTQCPDVVDEKQLDELGIAIRGAEG